MLTKQQRKFVKEYLKSLCAVDAALKAGYKPSNANVTAALLLESERITGAFEEEISKMLKALDVPIGYVVKRLVRIAEFAAEEEEGAPRDAALVLKALDSLCKRIPAAVSASNGLRIEGLDVGRV